MWNPTYWRNVCCQFWQTHPIRAHLRVSLPSSMRLTMTIRRSLTLTTLYYRCSRGDPLYIYIYIYMYMSDPFLPWVRGLVLQLGVWYSYEIGHWLHVGNLLRPAFRNWLKCHLLPSNRHGFRNRLCHSLQSIILLVVIYYSKCHRLSLSLIVVNGITNLENPISDGLLQVLGHRVRVKQQQVHGYQLQDPKHHEDTPVY
jgi:hypothetical protein